MDEMSGCMSAGDQASAIRADDGYSIHPAADTSKHHDCLLLACPHVTKCFLCAGGVEVLVGHSEVVMCDFAACLLAELERWMLNASPAMIDLNSFADTSDYFTAPTSALEEVSKRLYTDEVRLPSCMTAHTDTGHQSAWQHC